MDDLVEVLQRGWIGEDDRAQLAPVDLAVLSNDRFTESVDDCAPCVGSMTHHIVRHSVGVERLSAEFLQFTQNE